MAISFRFRTPMLAKLTEEYFDNAKWIFERKLDGERVLAAKSGSEVRLYSRNNKILNRNYPELVASLQKERKSFVVDGEVVAFTDMQTDFGKLQNRMHSSGEDVKSKSIKVYYYLFDIINVEGKNLEGLPLIERKSILKRSLSFHSPVRYLSHVRKNGISYHRQACDKGWEGIIAKDAEGRYLHKRSSSWLKFKCSKGQELVIGGYTDPQGSRSGFGALLLGFYRRGKLHYAGKVGTGFNTEVLNSLTSKLKSLQVSQSPFANLVREKGAHFVRPRLVAQVAFTQWTGDDKLRQPRFLGLRRDKSARSVVKE